MIRHLAPSSRRPSGLRAAVHAAIRRDFGMLVEPFTLHDPVPPLLAGFWMLCREATIAGGVPRAHTEVVATAVSAANRCPYCVDAHVMLLHATAAHATATALGAGGEPADATARALAAWARATRTAEVPAPPMAPECQPELLGTVLAFHYVNRMVSVLLDASPFPTPARRWAPAMRRIMGRVLARAVRRGKTPGTSLSLLPEAPLPGDLGWAAPSPAVAGAVARFAAAVDAAGATALSAAARAHVTAHLDAWTGADPGLGRGWADAATDGLDAAVRPEARLALLVARAPWQVDDEVVGGYRAAGPSGDDALVGALAWSAFAAARRIAGWTAAAARRDTPAAIC